MANNSLKSGGFEHQETLKTLYLSFNIISRQEVQVESQRKFKLHFSKIAKHKQKRAGLGQTESQRGRSELEKGGSESEGGRSESSLSQTEVKSFPIGPPHSKTLRFDGVKSFPIGPPHSKTLRFGEVGAFPSRPRRKLLGAALERQNIYVMSSSRSLPESKRI